MALTKKQLEWARRVYSPHGVLFCHFPVYSEKKGWGFCGSQIHVHIHHCSPQGWCKRVLHSDPDYATNLIAICELHHVGKGYKGSLDWRNDLVPVIHTDMAWAFRNYKTLGRAGFEKVFSGREELTKYGHVYWNTDWDLCALAEEIVHRYVVEHPNDPFPKKK